MGRTIKFPLLNKIQKVIGSPVVFSIGVDNSGRAELLNIQIINKVEKSSEELVPDMSFDEATDIIKKYEKQERVQLKKEADYLG
jgi:hypothetical protein